MMTLEDYANDVGKTIEEIKILCDKVRNIFILMELI